MEKTTLLFADNDSDFLETRTELLEREGYRIVTATNPEEAQSALKRGGLDLAILDIRLQDNLDDADISGLLVAKEAYVSIPLIILTDFPDIKNVRIALAPTLQGVAVAVDFIAKSEGVKVLLKAIQNALHS